MQIFRYKSPPLLVLLALLLIATQSYSAADNDLRAALGRNDLDAASSALEVLLAERPHDAEVKLLEAELVWRRGDASAAEEMLKQLGALFPDRPEPLNNLALLAAADGRLDDARRLLEAALSTHPGYRSAHQNLARVYSELAAQSYRKALGEEVAMASGPALNPLRRMAFATACDSIENAAP